MVSTPLLVSYAIPCQQMSELESVWVFNGARSMFPSGVFGTKEMAEEWIRKCALTGTLTQYPMNVGMYDFAIATGTFSPRKPHQTTSEFISKFSGGGLDHFHYEDGLRGGVPYTPASE
jgi:hypothetical protein